MKIIQIEIGTKVEEILQKVRRVWPENKDMSDPELIEFILDGFALVYNDIPEEFIRVYASNLAEVYKKMKDSQN